MAKEFRMESGAVAGAAGAIEATATTIEGLTLGTAFSTLSGAFTGATNPMTDAATNGDHNVKSALTNAGGHVRGWSETISGFKNSAVEMDDENAETVKTLRPLPTAAVIDPDNVR